MANQFTQLPMRKNNEIETRPMYVEEWLDSLPYIDFVSTSQLMHESLKATNKVQMKPGQRMELVTLYNRPYQYYVDSQGGHPSGSHRDRRGILLRTARVHPGPDAGRVRHAGLAGLRSAGPPARRLGPVASVRLLAERPR